MMHTDYRNQCIGFVLGGFSTARPAAYYFGISKTAIKNDGTGITEPSASTAYGRVKLDNNSTMWNAPANGLISNKKEIRMPELVADSGTATHFFLSESATGGKAFWWDKLPVDRPLVQWGTLLVKPGDAKFSIENPAA